MDGFWVIRDLGSTNGIKVNGDKVPKKLLRPGDKISIAKKTFTIEYDPPSSRRAMEEILEDMDEEAIMAQSLLERAGLMRPRRNQKRSASSPDAKPQLELDIDRILGTDAEAAE
jgi:pSer/pThr/pTyr-binding forkhead associated (FHA) protein